MKILLTSIVIAISLVTTSANAWISNDFLPRNVGSVAVKISDSSDDGCWTNLREAKAYAEDKLDLAGFKIRSSKAEREYNGYTLTIEVHSLGQGSGKCYGSINIEIDITNDRDGIFGFHQVGTSGSLFSGYDNANKNVIKHLSKFFKELP
tara:strand:- start:319 stop:768 length:450 start_codon:yes stop_codon:yes gene_type:complete